MSWRAVAANVLPNGRSRVAGGGFIRYNHEKESAANHPKVPA
jgi:hypothetical protein